MIRISRNWRCCYTIRIGDNEKLSLLENVRKISRGATLDFCTLFGLNDLLTYSLISYFENQREKMDRLVLLSFGLVRKKDGNLVLHNNKKIISKLQEKECDDNDHVSLITVVGFVRYSF